MKIRTTNKYHYQILILGVLLLLAQYAPSLLATEVVHYQSGDGRVTVAGTTSVVIVKNNYGGTGVSKKSVTDNPSKYLAAITVMFKRKGYDADNADWFWVKYSPKGDVLKKPRGIEVAAKVAKGAPKGCIACHTAAPGGDRVYNHNRYAN